MPITVSPSATLYLPSPLGVSSSLVWYITAGAMLSSMLLCLDMVSEDRYIAGCLVKEYKSGAKESVMKGKKYHKCT